VTRTDRDGDTELAQQAANAVDASRASGEVARTQPVQCRDRLLIERLDRYGVDRLVACSLEDRLRVGPVRLVAVAVTAHVGRRKQ
jgi:hypothetical protein